MRERDPHPLHGCRPAGELGPPGDADGAGADRLPPLHAGDAALARAAGLAGPRPLRALLRARVDAAVLDAPPRRPRRRHRADPALPPDRLALRRASGVRPRPGGRDDHRPARPGHRHFGRDGARRAHAGRALQPRRARAGRQLHLLHRVRRRHAGGGGVRGLLGRRPPRSREADRLLRRQPHLDRGRHRAGVLRGRRRATRPTAGTSRTCTRTSRSTRCRPRSRRPSRRRAGPA